LDELCNFVLDKGEVYAWGHGGQGQLGQPSIQNQRVPVIIKALSDDRIIFVACGGSSSAAVSGFFFLNI
jgi:alpha-tubulin suppressor-like RCC1 family protein